ncbi:MAG: hypothetical protein KC964_28830 [Candidatus Omnitrophica bacterium]|nr:hypothetical protein [Candidatus Omnitrophota bacterium]
MANFPRTTVGNLSVSRLVIGTNWFLGYSHCTLAKDAFIKERFTDSNRIAEILEVFFRAGVDTVIGPFQGAIAPDSLDLLGAIRKAQERTGVGAKIISTPTFPITPDTPTVGFDMDEVNRILDIEQQVGSHILMPHTNTTDVMVDRCTREIRQIDAVCEAIRGRGMIPGLSTHLPEAIVYADETGLDVETYISIFNAAGFLMPLEVDWTQQIICRAKKPVLTIKPLAAGQIRPLQGLTFSWNAIRDQDMIAVGTMTPKEAEEVITLSWDILDRRQASIPLQETRSKASVKSLAPNVDFIS